jgi:hypothetical protein
MERNEVIEGATRMRSAGWIFAAVIAVACTWKGGFSKQWTKYAPFSCRPQYKYSPSLLQRSILIAANVWLLAYSLFRIFTKSR